MNRAEDLGMVFERCIDQRELVRNQLAVAVAGLEEIQHAVPTALVVAMVRATLAAIQQLQDEADDRKPRTPMRGQTNLLEDS